MEENLDRLLPRLFLWFRWMLQLLSVDAAILLVDTILILWSDGEECRSCKEKGVAGH